MKISEEILYIFFGLAYFLYGLWKNLKKKPVVREEGGEEGADAQVAPPTRRREQVSDPFDETVGRPRPIGQYPSSFEELLEEFDGAPEEARQRAEQKVRKVKEIDEEYEPVTGSESTNTEQEAAKRMRETEMRKTLQEKASAAARAEVVEQELRRSRKQRLSGEEAVTAEEKRFEAYQEKNKRGREILKILRNPESLKNTIVATEILQRKYF